MLRKSDLPRIPKMVWTLGCVSLFMDVSSELVHALLPVFLISVLGAGATALGWMEGVAEAVALIVKVFSGAMSDFLGRRKGIVLLGYGLSAVVKPLFPLAHSAQAVFAARLLDRFGKGIRGAPRDALIADVTPPEIRGAGFGLRQSLDTIGAFLGPALATVLMLQFANDVRRVLWFAVWPAQAAVLLIIFGVREPEVAAPSGAPRAPGLSALKSIPRGYWWVVAIGAVFTLARFSEAFLVLRAQQTGFGIAWVPMVMVVMSAFYSASAWPAGILSDRIGRRALLAAGLVILVVADLALAQARSAYLTLGGVALWGIHMGCTQGILAAMIADLAPADIKATAFGVFSVVSGVFLLLASVTAGWLWDRYGAAATFHTGAAFAATALLLLRLEPPRRRYNPK